MKGNAYLCKSQIFDEEVMHGFWGKPCVASIEMESDLKSIGIREWRERSSDLHFLSSRISREGSSELHFDRSSHEKDTCDPSARRTFIARKFLIKENGGGKESEGESVGK